MLETNVESTEQQGAVEEAKQTEETTQTEEKTFTQEEVNKIIEKRLSRERQKFSSVLNGDDPREQELEERERAVAVKELQADAKGALAAKGLSMDALELLNYTDKESCDKSVELLGRVVDAAVEMTRQQFMRGGPPLKRAPQAGPDAGLRGAFGLNQHVDKE